MDGADKQYLILTKVTQKLNPPFCISETFVQTVCGVMIDGLV